MKTTLFVAALAAMILGQASVSAADSTPAILKSVKAKKSLNAGQMKKVKGEYVSYALAYYNLAYNGNNLGLYGKANFLYRNNSLTLSTKYNVNYSTNYNPYLSTGYYGNYSVYGYGY